MYNAPISENLISIEIVHHLVSIHVGLHNLIQWLRQSLPNPFESQWISSPSDLLSKLKSLDLARRKNIFRTARMMIKT